ncbi:MAG: SpoIIE family protein phosphatase [Lachnospiraceae bacterium]|jgi:sigma-B regulation protein RsbU (phosphoserine phosphatase)|nr:SpoIIE family protein phosphatase [Lachnospiraceae bacterium]
MKMNKKSNSIQKKVIRLTLTTMLISLLVIGTVNIIGILYLRNEAKTVYSELGETVPRDFMSAFGQMAGKDAEKLTIKRAELMDAKLETWHSASVILAGVVEDIVMNPQSYNENPLNPNMIWLWHADGIDPSDYEYYNGLLGNAQGAIYGIDKSLGTAISFFGTEQGFYISGSRAPEPGETFDPRGRPWYVAAKAAANTIWTEIYMDAMGHGLTVTCATPFYDSHGNLAGVVGLDMFLKDLDWIISDGRSWESETTFIVGKHGEIIVSSNEFHDNELRNILELMISEINRGITDFSIVDGGENEASYIFAYTPLKTFPWSIVTLIDLDEVYSPANIIRANMEGMIEESAEHTLNIILLLVVLFAVLLIVTAFLSGIYSNRLARSLTKPITVLEKNLESIARGNLDTFINIKTDDEIERLAGSINTMTAELKDYIEKLTEVTAEKERIGAELDVANRIQASMLPCIFPPFPEMDSFDLYASMEAAKEVGGDFYDFFLVDENTLAVVIADVSGKGVPAALFMVIAKTLIKNNAQNTSYGGAGMSPAEVFTAVNDILCENNDEGMFVTAFMGYLDIPSGRFTYVNAGHNLPLIKRADGDYEFLQIKPAFILAGFEGVQYIQHEIILSVGDVVFLYTDGVTEAENIEKDLFSDPRLIEKANEYKDCSLNDLVENLKREIVIFANGAEQADDITMLALKITGESKSMEGESTQI